MPDDSTRFSILLICTGNICRSALAELLGRAYLDETLGADADQVRVASAGTQAVAGSGMHPDSALVLRGFGGNPESFTARQLTDGHILDADLLLTMTRAHRRDVLTLAPRALARTFTLREAADLLALLDDDLSPDGPTLADRARSLVGALSAARSRRQSTDDDDIADPVNRPLAAHQDAGDAIVATLLPLLSRIAALRTVDLPG